MPQNIRIAVALLGVGVAALVASHDTDDSRLQAAQTSAKKKTSKADGPPPVGANAAEKGVYAALDEAIDLLEEQRYAQFFVHYLPVDDLRRMRQHTSPFRAAFGMAARQAKTKQLISTLKLARRSKPEFSESNMVVHFRFEQSEDEQADPGSQEESVVDVGVASADDGYDGDLKSVLDQGGKALAKGDVAGFVTNLFPVDEVKRMRMKDSLADVTDRIKQNPLMAKQMMADLKALGEVDPKYNADKTVATWEFGTKQKGKPYRLYRFEKVDGNWRLSGKQAREARTELARQRGLKASGIELEVSLERLGDKWRLFEMPSH